MLVLKKLFSGNYLKKLHVIKDNFIDKNSESNIEEEESNIKEKNEIITEESIINNNKFYLISIYESSLDITQCEYDSIIKQYIQTPILHQKFFYIIFDSEIISSNLILLSSIGLFIYKFSENRLNLLLYEIFNIKCEPKDLLMYLKINNELNIIAVYSNTNLFFLYYYDNKINAFIKVNQINKLCKGYINHLNIFNLEHINDYFITSVQIKLGKKFLGENYVYKIDKEKNEINETDVKVLKDDNSNELIIKEKIKYINDIYDKIDNNYKDEKISEIRYDLFGKYIFIINENGFIILKNKKNENENGNGDNYIDLMMKFKFKSGTEIKKSFFIDYQKINNYHFLFFDNKISMFEEKNEILSRIKLISKQDKKILKNSNAIFHIQNKEKEISIILYNYKNDISFVTLKKEEQNNKEEINKYKINIITKITNESMFCLDGIISKNSKEEYKIIAICGLQGESRLIKYSNIFNEITLFNQRIDLQILSIIFPSYNFNQKYFSNIFITSTNFKSNLYSLTNTFKINHLTEFNSPALKIYPMKNNNENINYIIILKQGVGLISFNDNNNLKQYNIKQIYECKNDNSNNNIYILFSYYFLNNNNEYLVIYLTNRHLICFILNPSNTLFDIELNNLPQPSALGVIAIESLNKLAFIFGNYLNYYITVIYYNLDNNNFDKDKTSQTKLYDSSGISLLIPEDILIYNYYIFITTHTGDFIVLKFNENDLDKCINIIYNLENITINKSSLKFSQIDFYQEKKEFNIDLYSFKNAYNIKLNIYTNSNNEIICNNITQLTKYKFNKEIESSLLNFQKIYLAPKEIKVHFYFKKNCLNFSFFQEQITKDNLSIETLYNFPPNEKAIKLISITEQEDILILTNNLKLYLFNSDLNLILTKDISEDLKKSELKITGIKNYKIKEDDNQEKTDINLILLFGGFKLEGNKTTGILIIYQLIDKNLIRKKIISGYPKTINDACLIKKYIICSLEAALCIREYTVKKDNFESSNQDAKSLIISNYMNKITNLVPLNNFCNSYYLLTCDIYESFQLIKFNGLSPDKYETLGADLSLSSLDNIYPINNSYEEVFTTDKKGIISKFELKDDIYQINNKIDLKEFITKLYINNNKVIMIGLLGSIYFGEITDKNDIMNNKEYEKQLLQFQKDVFNEVCNINLKKKIEYEEAMLMSEKINNVLLIDTLLNFCRIYYGELNQKIKDFDNLVKALEIINDNNLLFKNQ